MVQRLKGRINEVNEANSVVGEIKVNYSDIKRATLEVEFKPVSK
jgi:ribosome maturation factor RimP